MINPNIARIKNDLKVAVDLFQTDPSARELPFFHSFPKSSCERAAALLTVAFRRKYRSAVVVLVKGRKPKTNELHFWVEVDQFVVDPTANQFDEYHSPFVCERPSPLEKVFPRNEEISDPERCTDLPGNSNGCWSAALEALCRAIACQS